MEVLLEVLLTEDLFLLFKILLEIVLLKVFATTSFSFDVTTCLVLALDTVFGALVVTIGCLWFLNFCKIFCLDLLFLKPLEGLFLFAFKLSLVFGDNDRNCFVP